MNSYNENLNSVVLTSLQNQSLAEKSIYSKLNATMFKLYYAEGATISAGEKLDAAKADLTIKEAVKNASVNNTNISNNQLASAKQANQYYKQSINNMAVCAANVQVAANAIVKLASDVGSIFSIVNAADRHSDIYQDTVIVRSLIDNTAHAAEETSKLAMDTSMYTSEVSVPTVLDKSTSTNNAINNLLTINSKAFDDASAIVNADNATLATLSAIEKLAEGALEDITIDYKATKQAYNSSNKELNLDLFVAKDVNTTYRITFLKITSPFDEENIVQDYHLIVVKDSKKATFSITSAEVVRQNNLGLPLGTISKQFIDTYVHDEKHMGARLDFLNYPELIGFESNQVIDSDGDPIKLGVNYVVFVMAVFTDKYKRSINNFSDFLSAPSKEFMLTNTLKGVKGKDIHIEQLSHTRNAEDIKIELDYRLSQNVDIKFDFEFLEEGSSDYTHKVSFNTPINQLYHPIHRCIFLPASADLNDFLLTRFSLQNILEKSLETVHEAEDAARATKLQIKKYEKEIVAINKNLSETKKEIARLNKLLASAPQNKDSKKWIKELDDATTTLANLNAQMAIEEDLLITAIEKDSENTLSNEEGALLPFFFNLSIAEQVSPSNYTQMKTKVHPVPKDSDAVAKQDWYAFFGPETTDNFGNFLIDSQYYYPVILTVSKDGIDNPNNYTNALSKVTLKNKFKFQLTKNQ